jgi:hypothetical protein
LISNRNETNFLREFIVMEVSFTGLVVVLILWEHVGISSAILFGAIYVNGPCTVQNSIGSEFMIYFYVNFIFTNIFPSVSSIYTFLFSQFSKVLIFCCPVMTELLPCYWAGSLHRALAHTYCEMLCYFLTVTALLLGGQFTQSSDSYLLQDAMLLPDCLLCAGESASCLLNTD